MSADSEIWYVRIADGTVHPATIDQIDDAFNAGHIGESTLVLPTGETEWKRLGELAGLSAPAETPSVLPTTAPAAPPSVSPGTLPSSLRPMSVDLGLDVDEASLRPKSGKKAIVAVLACALVAAGVAVGVSRAGATGAGVAAAAAPVPVVAPTPPADPVAPSPAASASDPSSASRFSDEQKEKLLAADKAREEQAKAKRGKFHPGSVHPGSRSYKAQGFSTGGNKYDPLNAPTF